MGSDDENIWINYPERKSGSDYMNNIYDTGCPRHGKVYLSIVINEMEDKLYERCTIHDCTFYREHKDRRVKTIPVQENRRK